MKYTLTGSLGNITQPLAWQLIKAGHQVTIISSQAEKATQIKELGATPAIGQITDIAFLTEAFKTADAVYTMIPPKYDAVDIIEYIHSIGRGYATAIRQAGVKKVVNLSSWGADNPAGCGPVTGLYFVEQELNALQGVDVIHLRPGYFYINLLHSIPLIEKAGILGNNYSSDTRLVLVHPRDVAAVAAEELSALRFTGKSFRYIGSDEATLQQIAAVLGKAIDMPELKHVAFSDEAALKAYLEIGLNENMATSLVELGRATREGKMIAGYLQHPPVQLGATKLEDFAAELAAALSHNQTLQHFKPKS
jgi:uncharacterized protein YbjT (DUF2867 family)